MKLKCYLRGIGLGILVTTALFLTTGASQNHTMTDEQIKARAKELGMIDNQYLSDYTYPTEEESESETVSEESLTTSEMEEETTAVPTTEEETESESVVETESTVETEDATKELADEQIDPAQKFYVIVVNKGDGSDTVSRKIFEAGLVPDAVEFDHYLMENGYDRRITTGNHEIPSNATMEEMAKILCSN